MTRSFEKTLQGGRDYLIGIAIGIVVATVAIVTYIALESTPEEDSNANFPLVSAQGLLDESQAVSESTEHDDAEFDDLNQLHDPESAFSTTAALHRRVAKLSAEELSSHLKQSSSLANTNSREQTQEMIGGKLASISPRLAFTKIDDLPPLQQFPYVRGVFREWAFMQLDDAIEYAHELESGNRSAAAQAILSARSDLPSSVRREIAQRLGGHVDSMRMAIGEAAAHNIDDPGRAWGLLVSDDLNDTYQLEELIRIAELWVEQEGIEILTRLYPDDGSRYNSSQAVTDNVVAAVSAHDPEAAFEYVQGLSGLDRYKLSTILATWARTNPNAAISALSKLDLDISSDSIQNGFIRLWVEQDLHGALQSVELFPKPMQLKVAEAAIGVAARTSPSAAVKLLEDMGDIVEDTSSIENVLVRHWAPIDPKAALEWVQDESRLNSPRRSDMIQTVVRELTRVDPIKAFNVALEQPTRGKVRGGMEADVIRDLCFAGSVDVAIELMPRVREESKSRVYSSIGSGLARTDQVKRAMSLGEELPESYRPHYFGSVASGWARSDPLQMLEELPRVPDDLKSSMAKELAEANKFEPVLTDEQMERVKTFLNEEDAKSIEFWESL
ncbi:MAG: hypothetical protein OXG08_07380 [Gammaproteobacteria bacterium]|nr:hypothetical protein [Gammaproteobacteria bacterium]